MSFEKHSNFNKLANFSEVKFGENKPVLEVELNEMQQIQNEARADIIRDTMPSGFVTLGEIDYEHCANNNNQIKLSTESIAYVNGYRITIPKDTIIEIGESDKEREDLVFLEVWKEAVNDIDTLTEYGGENNAITNNPIKDSRYPVATSQRVTLKYRIRHVSDLDFNKTWTSGTSSVHPYIGWNNTNSFSNVYAIGGDETITKPTSVGAYKLFRCATYDDSSYPKFSDDSGLWVAGRNDETSFEYFKNACIDGYVYAIPMFRLLRKPNVGLASPFEYKKIHNQLDPKKFAHLVGQENVEKVHSVNIQGTTYKNLNDVNDVSDLTTAGDGAGVGRSIVKPNHYRWSRNSGYTQGFYPKLALNKNSFSPNTVYTIQYTVETNTKAGHGFCISYGDAYEGKSNTDVFYSEVFPHSFSKTTIKRVFTTRTPTTNTTHNLYIGFGGISDSEQSWFEISNLIILEGDYSHVEDLTLLPGIQSLGENTNNSITVENNLVEEGTYVHELQNHILPTHPEVTHITWGEDVVIPPEVEIELKNGEEVIQTITQLPVKLETTGEEKLHVKTMKGQTLVNVNRTNFVVNSAITGDYENAISKFDTDMKASTTYTVIAYSDNQYEYRLSEIRNTTNEVALNNGRHLTVGVPTVFTTNENFTGLRGYLKGNTLNIPQGTEIKILIIEGDHSNENIPYFEGMQSVKMPVLKTTGKNLFDINNANIFNGYSGEDICVGNNNMRSLIFNVKEGCTYTIQKTNESSRFAIDCTIAEPKEGTKVKRLFNVNTATEATVTIPIGYNYIVIYYANSEVGDDLDIMPILQIEEGSTATPYEPYKSNILRTPSDLELRGVGEVQDTLDLMTGEVTERIGEIVLDGSDDENWVFWDSKTTNVTGFYLSNQLSNTLGISYLPLCNLLPSITTAITEFDYENIYVSNSNRINLNISNSKATTVEELKTYLKTNPLIVQYQFKENVVKKIGLSEDDYVGKSKVTYQLAEPLRKVGTYSDFIEGKTLYSNIGVEVLNGSENIAQRGETLENTLLFVTNLTDLGIKSNLIYSDKFDGTDISWNEVITSDKEFIRLYTNDTNALYIRISKSKLATQDVNGFKKWLQDNPVTIYYVKANPVEIPLKEVSPLECDFSYNRQFKREYEEYLKELPSGLKDTVDGNLITRNIDYEKLVSSLDWSTSSYSTSTHYVFFAPIAKLVNKPSSNVICNGLPTLSVLSDLGTKLGVFINNAGPNPQGNILVSIPVSYLPSYSVSEFNSWLNSRDLKVLYELQTPTTEELTEENSRYVPYMPLNSYVGSLYVADGINQTKFLTAFSPSEYEVQTYHRYFSNEFNMFEDITLKKSPYGHKTYLEEVDGKYVEKFIAGLEKHEIEDLRHKVSLTGFDYSHLLQYSFLKLIKGELS